MSRKAPTKRMNTRYYKNREVIVDKYTLSITTGGTAYLVSAQGNRKLDSMFQKGTLQVVLPNDKTVIIIQNEKGELEELKPIEKEEK